ncbi:PIN domain-like protein [Auricularia subglabra TFB-10046 SS5]|uniref:PIN domain-like protein n=1 Tax=Auricularia subglabra (strain TFB-10046 / SS5) TaxID=717982 RepID=J0WP87_AURST|nr:PIN domain-like protein [Auricularia subglabra TFB-10046 SS5]
MGVKGLWSVLQPAAESKSVAQLAMHAFEANTYGYRGYRVGIDVSVWLGHMKVFDGTPLRVEQLGLQMLFFRCARLLAMPILPLFVFDGLKRPAHKRGKTTHYTTPRIEGHAQNIISSFGFEWRKAPGEAEADLAWLNSMGLIDAVWTDDGDAFLFGATTVMRNPGRNLSSNIRSPALTMEGKQNENQVHVFHAEDLIDNENIRLDRNGLILVALLRGGDYHEGIDGVGMTIAHALARAGFGDTLAAAMQSPDVETLAGVISQWRSELVQELRTDSQGHLGRRHPALAASIPLDFPDLDVYNAYANPVVSNLGTVAINWYRLPNLTGLAQACERHFEWGSQTEILERFRSLVWQGAVCRALRQQTLKDDGKGDYLQPGTPNIGNLVVRLHGERSHHSTGGLRELRVEIGPGELAQATRRGTSYQRIPTAEYTHGKVHIPPDTPLRIWLPAALIHAAMPELVHAFNAAQDAKQLQKGKKRVAHNESTESSASDDVAPPRKAARTATRSLTDGRLVHNKRPSPRNAAASSNSGTPGDVIIISSGEDDIEPGPALRARATGSAAKLTRNQDSDVIIIASSDDE